jgi:hypothetical protein
MSDTDICELLFHGMTRDASLIGCARGDQLAAYLSDLEAIQDEIARAVEKARRSLRLAA